MSSRVRVKRVNPSLVLFLSVSHNESEFEDVRSRQSHNVAQVLSVSRSIVKYVCCIFAKMYECILLFFVEVLNSVKPTLLLTFWRYSSHKKF